MAAIALIAVGALALLTFALFWALVEMFRDVRQMRDALGILDRPLEVDIGPAAGTSPGSHGLPRQLDEAASALVLFLSDRCATCRVLAGAMGGALPAGLWIVVEAASDEAAAAFVESHGLTPRLADGRVAVDSAGAIAARLNLNMTPVAYRVENGVFKDAATVPSMRTLSSMIPSAGRPVDVVTGSRTLMPLGLVNARL